ncbi:YhcN/YlaJ family sporulation lipoprotein [Tissierella carlieri]|uniref:YhcN/YlaJ family sporulation lipoprotein n=1 Tax=Tissierella carlieri TaxID=689904 RepID=UPI0028063542|nr:YhcN/YlaJ family sporulation lipoprotein [uncultured Tissierella sp.]MDU5080053.1 YhcN/YlaJ family sporulation lipoprotein [Bacillota bacterium]
MKKNKIKILGLSIVLLVAMAGCRPANTNMRNMSTQTRLYNDNLNNRWMTNTPYNTRDRLNTNLNNGMVRDNTNLNNNALRNTPMTYDSLRGNNLVPGTTDNGNIANNNLSTRATAIAKRVAELPEVKGASVIIHGNTALVGCELEGNTATKGITTSIGNTTTTGTTTHTVSSDLRKKVEAAVKVADKNIKHVSVTSDPTLHTRIRTISTNINSGHPISTFVTDIEDILTRITAPIRTAPVR